MKRSALVACFSFVAFTVVSLVTGCSKPAATETPAQNSSKTSATVTSPDTQAASKAAADFVDALVKGDSERANSLFTPQAVQQAVTSGKKFDPPGWPNTTYRMGEVRTPAVDRAFVHCFLVVNNSGTPHDEEMCCLMRLVDNTWRVSGIAYWDSKNPGTLQDFETGQSIPIPRNTPGGNTVGQPGTAQPGQTVPPRMAQEPAATSPY
jgi:hypothetical protein